MRSRALLALAALSAGLAAAAPAHAGQYLGAPTEALGDPACRLERQNRAMVGGAIGAAIGAVIGNNVAARNAQPEGSALGGLVGAGTGALIGRAAAPCNARYRTAQQPPPAPYANTTGRYREPELLGGPDDYGRSSAACRWGEMITRDRYGREMRESLYLCPGADGVWRPQR